MISLTVNKEILEKNIRKAREQGIILPTFKQMRLPEMNVPEDICKQLKNIGLWDINPLNLFRITWKNEPVTSGGLYHKPNYIELPSGLTGVRAGILCMAGKYFPTGCHKVGASYGCLVPRLVTGQFDIEKQKAVWPSTGNYCRGGAWNSRLLSCKSVAILPEGMSRERFEWLAGIAGEVIATPGTESNVKEIFDKTKELKNSRDDVMVFNQFEEMGNYLWHFEITGNAISEAFEDYRLRKDGVYGNSRLAGLCLMSGSSGTLASGDYLKGMFSDFKIAVGEALQCPTILCNGFGEHRIEGVGDKHIPWIHNVRNTDMAIAIDDNDALALLRLFNEPAGREYLSAAAGLSDDDINNLSLMGISGIANILCAIKFAKFYELSEDDVVMTVLTDSAAMYKSRVAELREAEGEYTMQKAAKDFSESLLSAGTDNMLELTEFDRKRVHNLKYYTWVEQQGRTVRELDALWYEQDKTFEAVQAQADDIDGLIEEFNSRVLN